MPSGWPSAIAPPLTLTRSGSMPSSRTTASALRRERLVQLDQVDVGDRDAGALEQLAHRRDRADAHHPRVDAGDGAADGTAPAASAPSSRALSSLAITSAAAPSFIPLELPAVTLPPLRKAGLQRRQRLGGRVRPRMLVARRARRPRTSSSANRPAASACRPAALRAQRERVLVLARHAAALGHVLAGLAHDSRAGTSPPGAGSGSASRASCRRPCGAPRSNARAGLGIDERRPRHRLDAAGDEQVAVAGDHRVAGARRPPRGPTRTAGSAVTPATDCGKPASSTAMRATSRLSSPAWLAQPR